MFLMGHDSLAEIVSWCFSVSTADKEAHFGILRVICQSFTFVLRISGRTSWLRFLPEISQVSGSFRDSPESKLCKITEAAKHSTKYPPGKKIKTMLSGTDKVLKV